MKQGGPRFEGNFGSGFGRKLQTIMQQKTEINVQYIYIYINIYICVCVYYVCMLTLGLEGLTL